MPLKKIEIKNFTVFKDLKISFVKGINIFVGENGMGKTHLMKVLYAASQAAREDVSFSYKLVRVFKPDNLQIHRLINRTAGNAIAEVKVYSEDAYISIKFNNKTKKWDGEVAGESKWEKQPPELTSTFIPAKEILSNAWNLEAAVNKNNVDFDDTYVDIVTSAKIDISKGKNPTTRKGYLDILQKITQAKVVINKEKFYLMSGSQAKIEFQLVAEGIRKIALLWQLIKNGTLENGSILFWDEPEANINPVCIPVIVDMLLKLQNNGVQIFISTHDYILSKYFEIRRETEESVRFYSFFCEGKGKDRGVTCEINESFKELKNNPIMKAFDSLLDEVYENHTGKCQ